MSNRPQICFWVDLVAVAVKPRTLHWEPSFSLIISWSMRYVGLKLWDHSDAQWISSTQTIEMRRPYLPRSSVKKRSGVINSTLIYLFLIAARTVCLVWKLYCELMQAPGIKSGNFPSWSVISDIKGVTTRTRPGMNYAVYWYTRDLPPPVANTTRQFFFFWVRILIASSYPSRKSSWPNRSLRTALYPSSVSGTA